MNQGHYVPGSVTGCDQARTGVPPELDREGPTSQLRWLLQDLVPCGPSDRGPPFLSVRYLRPSSATCPVGLSVMQLCHQLVRERDIGVCWGMKTHLCYVVMEEGSHPSATFYWLEASHSSAHTQGVGIPQGMTPVVGSWAQVNLPATPGLLVKWSQGQTHP